MERLSREYRVTIAVPILQGLLATGQFTTAHGLPLVTENGNDPHVKRIDLGEKFAEHGFARRKMSVAVLTALNLAKELVDQTELEALLAE